MFELVEDFKGAVITILHEVKKNTIEMNER